MNSNESTQGAVSRRAAVAAGLAPLVVARHVLGGAGYQAPSDKLRIAAVGVGGVGADYVTGCKPGGWLLPEGRFKDFKQPEPHLPRCERADHYAEWIRACKAGKKSIMPIEFACDLTEFALLGTATLRRYSAPGPRGTTGWGHNGRSDPADVWSTTGGAHPGVYEPGGADAPRYWRSSKVLRPISVTGYETPKLLRQRLGVS